MEVAVEVRIGLKRDGDQSPSERTDRRCCAVTALEVHRMMPKKQIANEIRMVAQRLNCSYSSFVAKPVLAVREVAVNTLAAGTEEVAVALSAFVARRAMVQTAGSAMDHTAMIAGKQIAACWAQCHKQADGSLGSFLARMDVVITLATGPKNGG